MSDTNTAVSACIASIAEHFITLTPLDALDGQSAMMECAYDWSTTDLRNVTVPCDLLALCASTREYWTNDRTFIVDASVDLKSFAPLSLHTELPIQVRHPSSGYDFFFIAVCPPDVYGPAGPHRGRVPPARCPPPLRTRPEIPLIFYTLDA